MASGDAPPVFPVVIPVVAVFTVIPVVALAVLPATAAPAAAPAVLVLEATRAA